MANVILKVNGKSLKCDNRIEAERFAQNAVTLHCDRIQRIMTREIDSEAHDSENFRYFWPTMSDMFPNRPAIKVLSIPATR